MWVWGAGLGGDDGLMGENLRLHSRNKFVPFFPFCFKLSPMVICSKNTQIPTSTVA